MIQQYMEKVDYSKKYLYTIELNKWMYQQPLTVLSPAGRFIIKNKLIDNGIVGYKTNKSKGNLHTK